MQTTASSQLATFVRVELARRNLRQSALSAGIGLSDVQVSRRMTGRTDWTLSELVRLAEFLDVPLGDMFAATPAAV